MMERYRFTTTACSIWRDGIGCLPYDAEEATYCHPSAATTMHRSTRNVPPSNHSRWVVAHSCRLRSDARRSKRPCAPKSPATSRHRFVGPFPVRRLVGLLALVPGAGEEPIDERRRQLIAHDRLHGRPADVELAPLVVGGPDDRPRRHLRLKDRRHRLSLVIEAALHPVELRRVQCRHLNHGDAHVRPSCWSSQRSDSVKPWIACLAPQ